MFEHKNIDEHEYRYVLMYYFRLIIIIHLKLQDIVVKNSLIVFLTGTISNITNETIRVPIRKCRPT